MNAPKSDATSGKRCLERIISWDSILLSIPHDWQVIVSERRHLLIEAEFRAVFEMRWLKAPAEQFSKMIRHASQQWQRAGGGKLEPSTFPGHGDLLFHDFSRQSYRCTKTGNHLIFLHHPSRQLYLMLQFFIPIQASLEKITRFQCSGQSESQLWAIQDFQVRLPSQFNYLNHSMKAGMTSLHFSYNKSALHLCRLSSADVRLRENSLQEILLALTECSLDHLQCSTSDQRFFCIREPGLGSQVLFRLKRRKPFLLASIRYDRKNDRLLATTVEDIHPIDKDMFETIEKGFTIVPEKA